MIEIKMILTNRFGPDPRVYKEAKYLVQKGCNVEILCWDRENEYLDKETENFDGIMIKRFFPYARYGTSFKQLKSYLQFVKECREYLKNKQYDYIHCHDLDGIIAGYFAGHTNAKLIFDMHEIYEVNKPKHRFRYLIRPIVNFFQTKAVYIIYLNDFQKKIMLNKNKKKLILLPNYPDASNYKKYSKSISHKLRISYIGSTRQYHQLKNLMDACKDMDDVFISIHGGGVHYKRLKQIEDRYNNVQVTGKYDYKDSARLFSGCDVLYAVYPMTRFQTKVAMPVKLYEAVLTKTPVIVNKGTDKEAFIKEKDIGFAVDGDDIRAIRDLIQYILDNRNVLREKENNIAKIQFNYDWNKAVKSLDEIYDLS